VSILESINYNLKALEDLQKKKEIIETNTEELLQVIKKLETKLSDTKDCKTYYGKAIELLYQESIGALKDTINTALQYVIYDKNYEIDLALDDKRGAKSLSLLLIDRDTELEVDLKDGVGNGIRTIVSFVLKMYYLINKNSNILLLDEKYSALSEEYTERFFEFMKKMCDEKDFIIVIITHDKRFESFADYVYRISDGNVTKVIKEKA
jgi:DNA repair exonuclease SbcCD ATPase subunit